MITNLTDNPVPSYSVVRLSNRDENGDYQGQRHIGTYESMEEAEFILKKAVKMEKASILAKMQENNPTSYAYSYMTLHEIKLKDTVYNIIEPIMDNVTPLYTNGVSNVTHHMRSMRAPDRKIASIETDSEGATLSFKEFCMVQEAMPKLACRRSTTWTKEEIDDALAS